MRNHKRHFVLINMIFLLGLLLTASAFGREYSTETTESATADSAVRAPRPSRPAPAKAAPRAKRSAVTYSTEDIAESPSGTDPTTTGARDHTVYRTKMVPDTPHRPQAPNKPETPEGDGYYYGGGYPAAGGAMHIRPGPYLAGRHRGRRAFWPGLWDTDISYSWSGNSGGGELIYWPYGYRYSWGDDPDYSNASDFYQAPPVMKSDPNANSSHYRLIQPVDANELPPDPPATEAADKSERNAAKDG